MLRTTIAAVVFAVSSAASAAPYSADPAERPLEAIARTLDSPNPLSLQIFKGAYGFDLKKSDPSPSLPPQPEGNGSYYPPLADWSSHGFVYTMNVEGLDVNEPTFKQGVVQRAHSYAQLAQMTPKDPKICVTRQMFERILHVSHGKESLATDFGGWFYQYDLQRAGPFTVANVSVGGFQHRDPSDCATSIQIDLSFQP